MNEQVILVDTADRPVGQMEKMQAHREGRLHRAFSVFLFNDHDQVLLQRRALEKYHSGGLWSNTCCSHPRPGEDTQVAAERRLFEEMGITCRVFPAFSFIYEVALDQGLTEHEYDHVFTGQFSGTPEVNPEEVVDWAYRDVAEVEADLLQNPARYSEWFRIAFPELVKRRGHGAEGMGVKGCKL